MILEIIEQAPNTLKFDAHYRWNLITRDPDDNKFVDCAIVANAEFIVSDDKHFEELQTVDFPKVDVLRLEDFASLMKERPYKNN